MSNKEELTSAIVRIFAHQPPKQRVSTEKVRLAVAIFLGVPETDIPISDLIAVLREVDFAVPFLMLRGNTSISWTFMPRPNSTGESVSPTRKRAKRKQYKEKPLAESYKLKL
jgi:hypothetical protein